MKLAFNADRLWIQVVSYIEQDFHARSVWRQLIQDELAFNLERIDDLVKEKIKIITLADLEDETN